MCCVQIAQEPKLNSLSFAVLLYATVWNSSCSLYFKTLKTYGNTYWYSCSFPWLGINIHFRDKVDVYRASLVQRIDIFREFTKYFISFLVAQRLKWLPPMRETWVWSLGWEDPLEKEVATHSSILAWRIPWTEEPCRLQSTGSQTVGHDWATSLSFTFFHKYSLHWRVKRRCRFMVLQE